MLNVSVQKFTGRHPHPPKNGAHLSYAYTWVGKSRTLTLPLIVAHSANLSYHLQTTQTSEASVTDDQAIALAVINHIEVLREMAFNSDDEEEALTSAMLLISLYEQIIESHGIMAFVDESETAH